MTGWRKKVAAFFGEGADLFPDSCQKMIDRGKNLLGKKGPTIPLV